MTGEYTVHRRGRTSDGWVQHAIWRNGTSIGSIHVRIEIPFEGELAQAVAVTFAEHERRVSGDSGVAG